MKIEYVHKSSPNEKRIYNTEKALKNNPHIHMSQEDFDDRELKQMEADKVSGTIIEYQVLDDLEK